METAFDLEERLLDYAAAIIRFTDTIRRSPAGSHLAGQLLRAGTAALPNHGEAQAAESAADFAHKLSVCLKELRETRRWLRLAQRVPLVGQPAAVDSMLRETEELIRIFYRSLKTLRLRSAKKEAKE
ncbi:MAG TPA: four helix bundle protein [Opitutaceae bacterium]|nr:four helix bundle protein [Opitutaceae bacterium]